VVHDNCRLHLFDALQRMGNKLLINVGPTDRDYTSSDMHDDVATVPYVLDVSATPPLMIFVTQKVIIECPKLLGYFNTYK